MINANNYQLTWGVLGTALFAVAAEIQSVFGVGAAFGYFTIVDGTQRGWQREDI